MGGGGRCTLDICVSRLIHTGRVTRSDANTNWNVLCPVWIRPYKSKARVLQSFSARLWEPSPSHLDTECRVLAITSLVLLRVSSIFLVVEGSGASAGQPIEPSDAEECSAGNEELAARQLGDGSRRLPGSSAASEAHQNHQGSCNKSNTSALSENVYWADATSCTM